ncbi:hypothetical protein [Streptomyces hypolithicus]
MTDIAVGVAVRRSAAPRPSTVVSAPAAPVDVEGPTPYGVWGDELRARAWLWRRFGVGTYAGSGGTE